MEEVLDEAGEIGILTLFSEDNEELLGYIRHRREIIEKLPVGKSGVGVICGNPDCPHCLAYLKKLYEV